MDDNLEPGAIGSSQEYLRGFGAPGHQEKEAKWQKKQVYWADSINKGKCRNKYRANSNGPERRCFHFYKQTLIANQLKLHSIWEMSLIFLKDEKDDGCFVFFLGIDKSILSSDNPDLISSKRHSTGFNECKVDKLIDFWVPKWVSMIDFCRI